MTSTSSRFFVGCVVLMGLAGCDCNRGPTKTTYGKPRVLVEENGINVESEVLDFGPVPMTKKVTKVVRLTNVGNTSLYFDGFEKMPCEAEQVGCVGEGPHIQVGTKIIETDPVFGLDYEPIDLPVGETKELTFFFLPPEDMTRASVPHEIKLKFVVPNAAPGSEYFLSLKGLGLRGECDFPRVIDFGAVGRGDTATVVQTLKNRRMVDAFPRVGDIMAASAVFTLTPDSPRGEFTLQPNREKHLTFQFTPTQPGQYLGTISVLPADGCPPVQTRLVGTGVDNVLAVAPMTVEFGYVQPTLTVTQEVTFSNKSFKPVELSRLVTTENNSPSNVFKVVTMGQVTIPAGSRDPMGMNQEIIPGEVKVTLSFRPAVLGGKTGQFKVSTSVRNEPELSVALRGFGGGPDIDVQPANLNFGRIAYFSGSMSSASRRIVVRNVGNRPQTADVRANLKLGMGGMGKPFTVEAKNPNSKLSEICVGVFNAMTNTCTEALTTTGPGSYDASKGIEATAAAAVDIPVRIAPSDLMVGPNGTKEWEVTIYSNDPDEPETKVTITARPVDLPPCRYTVTPASVNFGVVTPPATKDLSFQVCNAAPATSPSEICLVSNLEIRPGSDAIFSLPAGSVSEKELAPQECVTVAVRAWPQRLPGGESCRTHSDCYPGLSCTNVGGVLACRGIGTAAGSAAFEISDPTPGRSQPNIPLTASLAPSCLVVTPGSLDFGTVQQGCNSPDRTFNLYNACPDPIRWVGSSLIAVGDTAQPMTPNCPGSSTCQEFNVVNQPNTGSLPACPAGGGQCLTQGGAMLPFQIKYRPVNLGTDSGAYRIQVVQGGQTVDYVVTLTGRGDTMGSNSDTFRQDARPKADILLVIDNSCSMDNEQMALGQNFSNFIKYATSSQVDFQLATTSTDFNDDRNCPSCETGDFCRVGGGGGSNGSCTAGTGEKILTPNTPNIEQAFAGLVNLGTNGSGTESCVVPAVRALTSPKITDPAKNGGFIRPDAVLAVVCITDALDQADQPVSFYLNQLLNIKGVQRPNMFSYNVIGPFTQLPSPCSVEGTDDGKHQTLVQGGNGLREEICTPNWATALENIGKGAFGFRTTFFLTGIPQAGNEVKVLIDGVELPPVDARGAVVWNYVSSINAVVFDPLYVPEPGKTLVVNYRVPCL